MNPLSMSAHLGMASMPPSGAPSHTSHKPKKKRPGRGKPGASHLAQLTQAHGAGNFAQAKTHALNYAKAVHQHMAAPSADQMPMAEPDTDDVPVNAGPTPTPPKPASTAGVNGLGQLAALLRKRSG